jgi:hypothetical protein
MLTEEENSRSGQIVRVNRQAPLLFGMFAEGLLNRPYKTNTIAIFTLLFTNVSEYCQQQGSGVE